MADFGIAEAALIIGAVGATAGAGVSYQQAQEANRNQRRSRQSAREAASTQNDQVRQQAELERQKKIKEAEQLRSRVRVAAARSGSDTASGDFVALDNQITTDTGINLDVLKENQKNTQQRINSGLSAQLIDSRARTINSLVAGFTGGLQGAQTGLSIGSAVDTFSSASGPRTAYDESAYFKSDAGYP